MNKRQISKVDDADVGWHLAVGGASGHFCVWLSLRQYMHIALCFALPAKQRLYKVPLMCDQFRFFVMATCLLKVLSYWTHPPQAVVVFITFDDGGALVCHQFGYHCGVLCGQRACEGLEALKPCKYIGDGGGGPLPSPCGRG